MRNFSIALSLTTFAVLLSACASSPENIKAASVDPAQFDYMTCAQLAGYASGLQASYKQAADQEENARTEDVIGYVVLQQPLGQESHAGVPAQIADLKGKIAAVQSLQASKSCNQQNASLDGSAPKSQ